MQGWRKGVRGLRDRVADGETAPWLFIAALALTGVAGLFGGASRENPIRLAAVELTAVPLAVLAIARLAALRRFDASMVILGLAILVPLVQLVPLPPPVWMAAPGHAVLAQALALLGEPPRWAPLSLFPEATLDGALALAPPTALFLATIALTRDQRRALAGAWIAVGVAGLLLGAAQLSEPFGGPAYPYATTNVGSLVGLFANRNHEAGLLLALIPLAAALAVGRSRRSATDGAPAPARLRPWAGMLAAVFTLSALVALGVVRSRAGVLLAAPAVVGALALLARSGVSRQRLAAAIGAALAVVLAVALFALTPILDRFGTPLAQEARFEAAPTVAAAAMAFAPLGAGVGAFEPVFRAAEPRAMLGPTFLNHAHDDYLELWLETGVIGAALLLAFLVWFAIAAARAWRVRGGPLERAASVAASLLLVQSGVDYPLRTETLACLFAFACGCLAASRLDRPPARASRHFTGRRPAGADRGVPHPAKAL